MSSIRLTAGATLAIAALAACASNPGARETLVLDDFDSSVMELQISHSTDHWGDVLVDAGAEIALVPGLGPDGSAAALVEFHSEVATGDVAAWRDAYLAHNVWLEAPHTPAGFAGVAVDVLPVGFSFAKAIVVQRHGDDAHQSFFTPVELVEGQWQTVYLPFELLRPFEDGHRLRDDLPLTVQLHVPIDENFSRFHFRAGLIQEGGVLLDNLRLVGGARQPAGMIADFEDPYAPLLATPQLINAGVYWDHTGGGEPIMRRTPGVRGSELGNERIGGGPEGSYLTVWGAVSLTPEVEDLLATDNTLVVQLDLQAPANWERHAALSLMVRSPSFDHAVIAYEDWDNELGYYAGGVPVNGAWSRIELPFSRFDNEGRSLAEAPVWGERPVLKIMFEVPPDDVREAAAAGSYKFSFDLDTVTLQ